MPSGRRRRQGSPDREGDADSSPLNHLIMQLVESQHDQTTQLLTTLAGRTAPRPTLTKLDVNDDVEAYLKTFERQMRAFDITEDQWSLYLALQLTGRAQQAYAALDGDEAADYETVKTAILRRFAINSDTYRQRLRAAKLGKDETANELRTRLLHYTTKWLDKATLKDEVLDALVLEQLYTSLPSEVARHVREQDPASASKAAVLADAYFAAHASSSYGQFDTGTRRPAQDRPRCMNCGRYGHFASNCWWTRRARSDDSSDKTRPATSARSDLPAATQADTSSRSSGSSWTEQNEMTASRRPTGYDSTRITCFRCGEQGHIQRTCPKAGANFCGTPHSYTSPRQTLRTTRFFSERIGGWRTRGGYLHRHRMQPDAGSQLTHIERCCASRRNSGHSVCTR